MRTATFVLGSQNVPVKRQGKKLIGTWGGTEDDFEREWILCRASEVKAQNNCSLSNLDPSQVAIVDNVTMLQYFGRHIIAAPEVYPQTSY